MKQINKLVLSLLLVTTQLVYASTGSTVSFIINPDGTSVITYTYTNPLSPISRSISTRLPNGEYISTFEYRDGNIAEMRSSGVASQPPERSPSTPETQHLIPAANAEVSLETQGNTTQPVTAYQYLHEEEEEEKETSTTRDELPLIRRRR